MAEHGREISLPDGLGASLPTVDIGDISDPVPLVHFNQFQAVDLLGSTVPKTYAIGDALALASSRGRDNIVEHLKGPARRFLQSVQAQALHTQCPGNQPNTRAPPQTLQYHLTLLALGIRTPIYVVKARSGVITAQLQDAYIQNQEIVLLYRADNNHVAESVQLANPETLRLRNGATMRFRMKFVEEVPPRWVWDWLTFRSGED